MRTEFSGQILSQGLAVGQLVWTQASSLQPVDQPFQGVELEIIKLQQSIALTQDHLTKQITNLKNQNRLPEAEILEAYELIVLDPELLEQATHLIQENNLSYAKAIHQVLELYQTLLTESDSAYFKQRAQDLQAVENLLLSAHSPHTNEKLPGQVILIGDDVSALDLSRLNVGQLQGIITAHGGPTAHTTIVAKGLGIPTFLDLNLKNKNLLNGAWAILDSVKKSIIINPSAEELNKYQQMLLDLHQDQEMFKKMKKSLNFICEDRPFSIWANASTMSEAKLGKELGAQGIGLYRSELLFLSQGRLLNFEEQVHHYREILNFMAPYPVYMRTLDLGADKVLPPFTPTHEVNPALGIRGLRLCLKNTDVFKTQIKAMICASEKGNLHLLIPMVTKVEEIVQVRKIVDDIKTELNISQHIPLGVMVEVPAVALLAEDFVDEVDFFSIGTNDLTQYTLAHDRLLSENGNWHRELSPAVAKLIGLVTAAAKKKNIPVSVCGELASNVELLPTWIKLGVQKVSVGPANIIHLAKKLF